MKIVARRGYWAVTAWLLCSHLLVSAEVYTWTDEKGKKHFADKASTPNDRQNKPITIPQPNIAQRFVPAPPSAPGNASPESEGLPASPALKTNPPAVEKKAKFSKDECEALKNAYDASVACYAECSTPVHQGFGSGHQRFRGGGRNNAKCGHCTQMPMPRC